jgi:hypothetical protein
MTIDINTVKFKDEYYLNPDGGRKAALDLEARVREYLETDKPDLATLPINIKAFANGNGLSKFLLHAKVVQSSSSLWDFVKGFSQAHARSDFVLVGNGKDRADEKVKGKDAFVVSCSYNTLTCIQVFLNSLLRIPPVAISYSEPAMIMAMSDCWINMILIPPLLNV